MEEAKAAKLAAARRKLKDHQQKKNLHITNSSSDSVPMENTVPQHEQHIVHSIKNYSDNFIKHEITPASLSLPTSISNNELAKSDVQVSYNMQDCVQQPTEQDANQHESQQQMQHHAMATEILIKEKRNLEAKVYNLEQALRELENNHAETVTTTNIAKQNIIKLDNDFKDSKNIIESLRHELDLQKDEIEKYKVNERKLFESKNDLEEQLENTKTLLVARQNENNALESQLSQVRKMLDISQLHLQQLRDGNYVLDDTLGSDPEALIAQNKSLQNLNSRLEQQVNTAQVEKEQLVVHYQQHIERLYEQHEASAVKCRQLQLENERLAEREANLIDQMSVVEKRLQEFMCHNEELKNKHHFVENGCSIEELEELKSQFLDTKDQLQRAQEECNTLKKQLSEREERINELTENIRTLETDCPDVTKLNAANESDRVAAQRATAQNVKLKDDLRSLQDAFVIMSKDKLDFTEKLQAEKFLNRELTIKLSETEETLKEIQNKLMAKDEEMIRLQANCSQLEKEVLQNNEEIDRLRHYEVTHSNGDVLQTELDLAEHTILKLNREISSLRADNNCTQIDDCNKLHQTPLLCADNVDENGKSIQSTNATVLTDTNLNVILPTDEAMVKLQQRFLRTMKDVAELSDEKQKLEHLVLQLQGETETICEYIALYQQQRGILKQREEERAAQLRYLAAEREHMKAQLEQLRTMITDDPLISTDQFKQDKVEKIVDLLAEIKQSHLIEPDKQCSGLENFHPCPWCSGKLIEV